MKTVSEIDISATISYGSEMPSCNCHSSSFTHHNHIVTGGLKFIENSDLHRLLSKGPNYKEPRSISWNKCLEIIQVSVSICSSSLGEGGSNGIDLTTWEIILWKKFLRKLICSIPKHSP